MPPSTTSDLAAELTHLQTTVAAKEVELMTATMDVTAAATIVEASKNAEMVATDARAEARDMLKGVKGKNKELRTRLLILVIARGELQVALMEWEVRLAMCDEEIEDLLERIERN